LQIKKTEERIAREQAILIAIQNVGVIANGLKQKDPEAYIKKKLKLTDFQVEVIMGLQVRSLKNKNASDVKKRIAEQRKVLADWKSKLKHLDKFIISLLEQIKKSVGKDTRGTRLRAKTVEIKGKQTGGMFVISNGKNLRKLPKVTGQFKLSCIAKDGVGVTTVSDHGIVGHWELMDIPDSDVTSRYTPIVGIVPYSATKMICLTNLGNVSIIEHPQSKDNYKAMKLKDKEYVVKAVGIREGDSVVFIGEKGKRRVAKFDELKVQRNNTFGKRAIPRTSTACKMWVVHEGCTVIDENGASRDDLSKIKGSVIYPVCKENYVDKKIMGAEETTRYLKRKDPSVFITI
jgi:DNA gyrase/topoisomerase IV subunit A